MVRSLVVSPHEDMRTWLKYASLCGKSGRLVSNPQAQGWYPALVLFVTCTLVFKALAHKTLVLLLGVDPSRQLDHPLPTVHPQVTYAYMKNMWKSARKVCFLPTQQRPPNVFLARRLHCPYHLPTVLGVLPVSQCDSQPGTDVHTTFGQTNA